MKLQQNVDLDLLMLSCILNFMIVKINSMNVDCGDNWFFNEYSGTCVKINRDLQTFQEARSLCKHEGRNVDLVKILTGLENSFIFDLIPENGSFWIGLNSVEEAGFFRWLSEIPETSFVAWKTGHPCSQGRCVQLSKGATHGWVTEDCSTKSPYICEKFPRCSYKGFGALCYKSCSKFCGKHKNFTTCDYRTGKCFLPCQAGYEGDFCKTPCQGNKYGALCGENCPQTCGGESKACHHVNGKCLDECQVGYIGSWCENKCPQGTFGMECNDTCGAHCALSKVCHHITGVCINGCEMGYQGKFCDSPCDNGTYGQDCERTCSTYCKGPMDLCNPINGTCLEGCEPGYAGPHCDINTLLHWGSVYGEIRVLKRRPPDSTVSELTTLELVMISACVYAAMSAFSAVIAGIIISKEKTQIASERKRLLFELKPPLDSKLVPQPEAELQMERQRKRRDAKRR